MLYLVNDWFSTDPSCLHLQPTNVTETRVTVKETNLILWPVTSKKLITRLYIFASPCQYSRLGPNIPRVHILHIHVKATTRMVDGVCFVLPAYPRPRSHEHFSPTAQPGGCTGAGAFDVASESKCPQAAVQMQMVAGVQCAVGIARQRLNASGKSSEQPGALLSARS